MPFALLFIGIILVLSAANGTLSALGAQLKKDFTGPGNFVTWLAAVGIIGALGYIPQLEKFSRAFIGLLLVVIFFAAGKQGKFQKFAQAITNVTAGNLGNVPAAGQTAAGGNSVQTGNQLLGVFSHAAPAIGSSGNPNFVGPQTPDSLTAGLF